MPRYRRHSVLKVGFDLTSFGHDDGVQGLVMLCDYGNEDSQRYLHLVIKDLIACERACVAAAGLDPDETAKKFAQRQTTGAPLPWKIDLFLYGEWSFATIRAGDVLWVRGKGLAIRPNRAPAPLDHPCELVAPADADIELEVIRQIPTSSSKSQPKFDPVSRVLTLQSDAICERTYQIAKRLDLEDDACTPLSYLDHGLASVVGIVVGQMFPAQTRGVDAKSILYVVDESNRPMTVNTFRHYAAPVPLGALGDIILLERVEVVRHRDEVQLEVKKNSTWRVLCGEEEDEASWAPCKPERVRALRHFCLDKIQDAAGPKPDVRWWPMQNKLYSLTSSPAAPANSSVDLCVRIVNVIHEGGFCRLLVSESDTDHVVGIVHVARDSSYHSRLVDLGILQPGCCVMIRAITLKSALTELARQHQLKVELFANDGSRPGTVATSFMRIAALRNPVPAAAPPVPAAAVMQSACVVVNASLMQPHVGQAAVAIAQALRCAESIVLGRVTFCHPENPCKFADELGNWAFCFALEDQSGRAIVAVTGQPAEKLLGHVKRASGLRHLQEAWSFLFANQVWLACSVRSDQGRLVMV